MNTATANLDTANLMRGRVMIVTAALLWSTSGFFAKAPWFTDWPENERGLALTFWRAVFAALLMVPLVRRPRLRWPMVPMGLAFSLMTSLFLTSMVLGSESNAIWLQYLAPAWVVLAGFCGIGDRATRRDGILIAAACIGVSFILLFEMSGVRPLASILALLSGVTFAVVLLSLRRMNNEDGAWLGFINHGTNALLLAPLVLTRTPWPTDTSGWP